MASITEPPSPVTLQSIRSWALNAFPGDFRCLPKENTLKSEKLKPADTYVPFKVLERRLLVGKFSSGGVSSPVWAFVQDPDLNRVSYSITGNAKGKLANDQIPNVEFVRPFCDVHDNHDETGKQKLRIIICYYFLAKKFINELKMFKGGFQLFKQACEAVRAAPPPILRFQPKSHTKNDSERAQTRIVYDEQVSDLYMKFGKYVNMLIINILSRRS